MTNTTRDYADVRRDLRPTVRQICERNGLDVPAPFSDEERVAVELVNAYQSAMTEMARERKRAGHRLAKRQVKHEADLARERIDHRMLPALLDQATATNPVRESLTRERARHLALTIGGGLASFVVGVLLAPFAALVETAVLVLSTNAVVLAPALATVVASLLVQTVAFHGDLTWGAVGGMCVRALWVGFVVLLASAVVFSLWHATKGGEAIE
jgi:hypothetical protein